MPLTMDVSGAYLFYDHRTSYYCEVVQNRRVDYPHCILRSSWFLHSKKGGFHEQKCRLFITGDLAYPHGFVGLRRIGRFGSCTCDPCHCIRYFHFNGSLAPLLTPVTSCVNSARDVTVYLIIFTFSSLTMQSYFINYHNEEKQK
jgi:hypothetical protein